MKGRGWIFWGAGSAGLVALVVAALLSRPELRRASTWERLASPGRLSAAHSFLESDCAACHRPIRGPEAAKCIACHANDQALLGRQPTAFHADIGSCRECHAEHRGLGPHPAVMDHAALAEIGLRARRSDDEADAPRTRLVAWIGQAETGVDPSSGAPGLSPREAVLNCAACHGTKDRHAKFFGDDCAQCHGTTAWTIPSFRHPSPRSLDCAQCHQAPPSHYMEHFHMVSAQAAGHHEAQVSQCYLCHQTTSWNDIKGIGWYKHH